MICRTMSSVQTERKPSTEVARRSDGRLDLWVCTRCGYTYDGELGEPVSQTAPGTPFETLPEFWRCPHCTAELPAPATTTPKAGGKA